MNSNRRKERDAAIIKRILAPPRNDNDHIQVYDIYDDNGIYVDSKAVIDMKARSREKGKVANARKYSQCGGGVLVANCPWLMGIYFLQMMIIVTVGHAKRHFRFRQNVCPPAPKHKP